MIREAILIGTNTATRTPLRGVDADIQRLYRHLTSEFGGAWEAEEIDYLEAPSVRELQRRLNFVRDKGPEFLMIAFSGHGFVDELNQSFICLRDGQDFPVENLQVAVKRQITIVDACRVVRPGTLFEGAVKTAGTGDVSGIDEWDYRASCRALFDARLRAVATGRALLQSCSLDETSNDYPAGGLFTHSLLKMARVVASNNSDWRQSTKYGPVRASFNRASTETQRINPAQRPTFSVAGQGANLPFFVA